MIDTTSESFDNIVNSSTKPILVDFWGAWCKPCQGMMPILDQLETQFKEQMLFIKVDIDQGYEIATRYDVQSLPTLMIIKDGQILDTRIGSKPLPVLIEWVKKYLDVK